jgi:hypothetical protein
MLQIFKHKTYNCKLDSINVSLGMICLKLWSIIQVCTNSVWQQNYCKQNGVLRLNTDHISVNKWEREKYYLFHDSLIFNTKNCIALKVNYFDMFFLRTMKHIHLNWTFTPWELGKILQSCRDNFCSCSFKQWLASPSPSLKIETKTETMNLVVSVSRPRLWILKSQWRDWDRDQEYWSQCRDWHRDQDWMWIICDDSWSNQRPTIEINQ